MSRVVVVGAGITGAATAWELAAAGEQVTLVDRYGPAAMASGWTLAGVRQSGRHPAELPLAQAAVADWEHLHEKLDAPTHYLRHGNLRLARTEPQFRALADMVAAQSAAGLELELLGADALRQAAPAVAPGLPGASFCPTDGHADAAATVQAFVTAAARLGATLRFGDPVEAIEHGGGRVRGVRVGAEVIGCDAIVLATGIMGNALLAPLGLHVPMATRAVTLLRTAPASATLRQVIGVADASCAGRQERDGRFRFTGSGGDWAGTASFAALPEERGSNGGPRLRPAVGEVARVASLFGTLVPAASAAALDECWVGLIDSTPDALPVIERAPEMEGLVLAMGFSGHGFGLGPATGRICAALARDVAPNLPIEPFRRARFAAGVTTEALTLHG